ncbi:site-specific DNA-methyltransferase [Streptomyces dubilierae]|uniref:DNA methyltransferase n=1 Tax=Streptomyces dubilierae TaxID=3075533 RepID=A0ABU2P5H7_9ACTN|nr:DNA methyltransferase [Streptomyces sp. DSM 41921]MDT0386884.1 DNA methyltransferase [Streptomyces sp. DSM 41921]
MSTLSNLLRQVGQKDPQLAADLAREVEALSRRRRFGLNFERHVPETVDLPGRPVRKGDKVRFLAERGARPKSVDQRIWRVVGLTRTESGRVATLTRQDTSDAEVETATRSVDDLVVVAEFRDAIFPGLISTGKVERGGEKPFHSVINAENYHALQTLLFTHEGKVDAIFIDPPYNTRDNDWKYNNDYVDPEDDYAHSKWLAFMERRLKLAKRLLNPESSALIVTIDEKEVLRLGLLLEQTFPEAAIQMVTSVISAKGAVRRGKFSRVEEHIFFLTFGGAKIHPWESNMLPSYKETQEDEAAEEVEVAPKPIEWLGLRRREPSSVRGSRPNQFYPIFVSREDGTLHSIGDPIDDDVDRSAVPTPAGTVALWPLKPDGTEMLWGLTPEVLRKNWANGYARVKNWKPATAKGTVYYLPSGTIERIRKGEITITGRAADGAVEGHVTPDSSIVTPPKRVWNMASHNAEIGGTSILSALIPKRHFPYPKSLFAVEDILRFVVGPKKDALVVDFFGGSGTTAHAVMRLNRQDEGSRSSIIVTNNEVSANEQARLRTQGLRPGDAEWERLGICDFITKPRLQAAVTGLTPEGEPVKGKYRFADPFPMSDGFDENIEFFTMTYEAPRAIAHHRSFEAVAPLLWLKAGARGRRIEKARDGFDIADSYGVLFDMDYSHDFLTALAEVDSVRMAFIVTDDDRSFQMVCSELPGHVEPVRLYESYLTNFTINTGRE